MNDINEPISNSAIISVPSTTLPSLESSLLIPPEGSIYLGAWVNMDGPGNATLDMLPTFEQQVGRKMALSMHYHGWNKDLLTQAEEDDISNGRVPVISWACGISNAQVASGAADAYIAQQADAVMNFKNPVFIRYLWEMNLSAQRNPRRQSCYDPQTDNKNGHFSAKEFISAWKHIRSIFLAHGARNVIWLWNPSGGLCEHCNDYYPGDDQVDWVGFDHYEVHPQTIQELYAPVYAQLSIHHKPMLIGETGAFATAQVAFFQGLAENLKTNFPLIKGVMYWDALGSNTKDWRLTIDGLAGFAGIAADPYFSARPP